MDEVAILPLIVDLGENFFESSRDALERARTAKGNQASLAEPTGLNIFSFRRDETQACLESIVFSFLTIEALTNFLYFNEQRTRELTPMETWLRGKWKRGLSIYDRFVLLVNQHTTAKLNNFPYLCSLLSEFIGFRNRIVHAHPEQYQALVEPGSISGEVLVHDVEPNFEAHGFPTSGLSKELGRINLDDASRGFEIMLLVVAFLDEQLIAEIKLPWPSKLAPKQYAHLRPRAILESLTYRHYSKIDLDSFVPDMVRKFKNRGFLAEEDK